TLAAMVETLGFAHIEDTSARVLHEINTWSRRKPVDRFPQAHLSQGVCSRLRLFLRPWGNGAIRASKEAIMRRAGSQPWGESRLDSPGTARIDWVNPLRFRLFSLFP